jgi:peroxiredoxin
MSRRNTYLLGGLAALAGAVMIAFAIASLTSDGGDSPAPGDQTGTAPRQAPPAPAPGPVPPAEPDREQPGVEAEGREVGRQLARRRPVRAPDLAAELINEGSVPPVLKPRLERATADGTLQLSKLRGTPVVLYLWSSQCAPCRANARLADATWKRWGSRGVLFVGVHVDDARVGTVKKVIGQYGITYPAVLDPGGMAARYGATALPQAFFISTAGAIVGQVVGSPSVRQLEVGTAAAQSGEPFGSEQGSARAPLD